MTWRLLLFVARRRVGRPACVLWAACALALAGATVAHVASARCCTLIVTGYQLDTSGANHLEVYVGDRKVAEASAFDGTLVAPGRARFVLPPGDYMLFVANDVQGARFTPSGNPLRVALPVRLDRDRQINIRQQLRVNSG